MGRTLSDARLDALIRYWDERLHDCEPTGPALRRLLRPERADQAVPDAATVRRYADAARALRAASSDAARRAWILRFLIDRGPDLLVDETRRRAALAAVRDRARRDRRRRADRQVVQVVLGAADVARLRSFAAAKRCDSLSEAIVRLLRDALGVPRRKRKAPAASPTADMLAKLHFDDAAESAAGQVRSPRHKP